MASPEVNIREYESLYEHYMGKDIDPKIARLGHFISDAVYRTIGHVHVSEPAKQEIRSTLTDPQGKKRLLLAGNHVSMADPFALAGAMRSHRLLIGEMITNTTIIGKHTLFLNPVTRYLLDNIGAVPAFLSRRTADQFASADEHAEYQRGAASALGDVAVKRMVQDGNHLVMYAEVGGRNHENPREVQPLHRGIGHIAVEAGRSVDVTILPVAVAFPGGRTLDFTRPEIVFGDPIPAAEFSEAETVVTVLRPALQHAVDEAFDYTVAA